MYNGFEEMMQKLSPTLRRISHRLNGRFTFFNEDDLFQEALAHLWVAFKDGKLAGKTDSYILQGCFYHLKNHIRTVLDKATLVSLNALVDDGDVELEEIIPDTSQHPDEDADERIGMQSVAALLGERERKVLALSCEGLTVREIGNRLGVSHVMVVKIKARIRKACSGFMKERTHEHHN